MHRIFRKGTLAALVIGLIVGVVGLSQANYSIRQNSDGTTDWVDNDAFGVGGSSVVKVGRQYITFRLSTASLAVTQFVVSPISGILYSAFAVQVSNPVRSMTTTLTFGVMQPVSPGVFVHPTTGGWIYLRPTQAQGTSFFNLPGTFQQVRGVNDGGELTPFEVTKMQGHPGLRQGGIISIEVGGEGVDQLPGDGADQFDIFIIIDPR